jgi:hypothetical protein
MGVGNPNDPNAVSRSFPLIPSQQADIQMLGLMDNPEFLRQMSDLMSRPEVVDQVCTLMPSSVVPSLHSYTSPDHRLQPPAPADGPLRAPDDAEPHVPRDAGRPAEAASGELRDLYSDLDPER